MEAKKEKSRTRSGSPRASGEKREGSHQSSAPKRGTYAILRGFDTGGVEKSKNTAPIRNSEGKKGGGVILPAPLLGGNGFWKGGGEKF